MASIEWSSGRLRSVQDLTADIRLFEIERDGPFMPAAPGAHINVGVEIAGRPDTRSYSVVGADDDGLYRIAVKRVPQSRGGSAYMWSLAPGARMRVSAPRNHFPLSLGKGDYFLVAGGIGITPLYGMALALAETGARFRLAYAARTRADLAFADVLAARLGDRLSLHIAAEGERIDLAAEIDALPADAELYICGPLPMFEAARRHWQTRGRAPARFRFETFGSSGRYASEPFRVKIPRLGKDIVVPQNQSLLEALEDAGVEMISDCRRGECGLCTLPILETDGIVDHRDVFFSDRQKAAGGKICTCVSRVSGGEIVLDTPDRAG
ncbi:PDR/VanB family oxidoreductase [Segnochrobactrum spirostomi]|uniref:Oxidoreductase n=1 Tax=Segnochrobactrum spirostomi TaxID=2608987 RepID=A0A6A7YDT0_9HYPH|nr:PDR/VanB family oxidoreductase [Segnochrobactrum spirostomi]MQT15579.1 oxidoreductase [Segnochrobactrum spirostomi]